MVRVLVTGAGGFVARHLRRALSNEGFEIVSVSRNGIPPVDGETLLTVSGYDDPAILEAAQGCAAAVHLVGSGRQTIHESYRDANYLPAVSVARICRHADIRRMIYLSGLGVSADSPDGYFISKYMAESVVCKSVAEPVIFRPSYVVGPDDYLTSNLRRQEQTGFITIPGSGGYPMQPIAIKDVVGILVMAVTSKHFAGLTLDMVGPNIMTFAEYVRAFAGPDTCITSVGLEEAYQNAIRGHDAMYGLHELNVMLGGYTGDHDALRKVAGMSFCAVPDTLQPGGQA